VRAALDDGHRVLRLLASLRAQDEESRISPPVGVQIRTHLILSL